MFSPFPFFFFFPFGRFEHRKKKDPQETSLFPLWRRFPMFFGMDNDVPHLFFETRTKEKKKKRKKQK